MDGEAAHHAIANPEGDEARNEAILRAFNHPVIRHALEHQAGQEKKLKDDDRFEPDGRKNDGEQDGEDEAERNKRSEKGGTQTKVETGGRKRYSGKPKASAKASAKGKEKASAKGKAKARAKCKAKAEKKNGSSDSKGKDVKNNSGKNAEMSCADVKKRLHSVTCLHFFLVIHNAV